MKDIPKLQLDDTRPPSSSSTHSDNSVTSFFSSHYLIILALVLGLVLGSFSGFLKVKKSSSSLSTNSTINRPSSEQQLKVGAIYGVQDTKTFKDIAQGVLQTGGIDGEGSHHLVRPGGPSQNVYLTSSVVDLDMFVGYKIKVWGQTFTAKKAGWLMDVGRVQVLDKPTQQ